MASSASSQQPSSVTCNTEQEIPYDRDEIASESTMVKFLLWLILLILCWPLAIIALIMYPIIWLVLLPFRLLGIAVDSVLQLIRSILLLPARVLRGPRAV